MAGIIHKIEEKLGMGGNKDAEKQHHTTSDAHSYATEHKPVYSEHNPEHTSYGEHKPEHDGYGEHKPEHGYGEHKPEKKEGFIEKIKDKIHGDDGAECKDGEKKKKEKKKKKHGEGHDGGSSSSSDSD